MAIVFIGLFGFIVDLDFVAVVYRHPFFARFNRNTDKDSGVAVVITHLVDGPDGAVAQFAARPVKQAHAALACDHPVFHHMTAGTDMLPASEVLAVEELLPVSGLRVHSKRRRNQKETQAKS